MNKVTACSLCGGREFKTLYAGLDDKMHKIKGKRFSVIQCTKCSLALTSPAISSEAEFSRYYPEQYYSYNPPMRKKKSMGDHVALYLYNLFYNPSQWWNPMRHILWPISYFVRGAKVVPGARILDIGCGAGFFLERMRALGMKPYGIELGKQGYRECLKKGISAWNQPVEKAKMQSSYFDVITINAVLEHVTDVKATLHACKRVLKKNGTIVIMVPNIDGYTASHYGECWADMDVPRHITHFNRKTIAMFMEDAGLKVIKIKGTGSSFQFVQSIAYKHPGTLLARVALSPLSSLIFNIPVIITNIFKKSGRLEIYATKK